MPAANPEDTNIRFHRLAGYKVHEVSAIISMDAAVPKAATDGTGFLTGLKTRHVRVKKRF